MCFAVLDKSFINFPINLGTPGFCFHRFTLQLTPSGAPGPWLFRAEVVGAARTALS